MLILKDESNAVGILGIQIFKNPLGHELMANEHYWYVMKDYRGLSGIRLLKTGFKWAKDQGCTHFICNASNLASELHDGVCKLYKKMGMKHFETTYIMEV